MTEATSITDPRRRGAGVMRPRPPAPAKGGVVVVQEAFGLTDHIGSICDRLAEAGWLAVAPALFHRQGAPTFALGDFDALHAGHGRADRRGHPGRHRRGHRPPGRARPPDRPDRRRRVLHGRRRSPSTPRPAARSAPRSPSTAAGVVEGRFGFPALVELAPGLQTPWLGLYGDLDKGIPPEQAEALRDAAAAQASVRHRGGPLRRRRPRLQQRRPARRLQRGRGRGRMAPHAVVARPLRRPRSCLGPGLSGRRLRRSRARPGARSSRYWLTARQRSSTSQSSSASPR